ncbi:Lar family restriction alleviation protein [Tardiphaga sp. 866_E4_N2_1]|uniref:Lar family restriction alleviation protein n=1 Tax=unclassified Tardiphaga TaxID=2631404 RepID=UPI003F27601B
MSELLPCPFCGGNAELQQSKDHGFVRRFVYCQPCGARSPNYHEDGNATYWWNTRHPAPETSCSASAVTIDRKHYDALIHEHQELTAIRTTAMTASAEPIAPKCKTIYVKPLRTLVAIDERFADRIRDLLNATPPSDAAREALTADDAWHELVEKDDRNSPEEYPEMCLITIEELRNFMDRAALSAAPVSAWQEIDTAPKDGTNFVAIYGDDFDGTFWILFWNDTCFECVSGGYQVDHATHWMPLPAPPISRNERGGAANG